MSAQGAEVDAAVTAPVTEEAPAPTTANGSTIGSAPQANDKNEAEDADREQLLPKIRRQVEFYFSDSNLIGDRYLFNLVEGSKNNWVDLKNIHRFKRMQGYKSFDDVAEAVKRSDILEVDERNFVRRKVALDPEVGEKHQEMDPKVLQKFEDGITARSINVKGLGPTVDSELQHDLEEYFEPFGPIAAVRLRRNYKTKEFKGSAFVEFETVELMQQYLDFDGKPEFRGKRLEVMGKQAYFDRKAAEYKERNGDGQGGSFSPYQGHYRGGSHSNRGGGRGGGRGDGRGGRGGRGGGQAPSNWKKGRADFQKSQDFKKRDREDNEVQKAKTASEPEDKGVAEKAKDSTAGDETSGSTEQTSSNKREREEEGEQMAEAVEAKKARAE